MTTIELANSRLMDLFPNHNFNEGELSTALDRWEAMGEEFNEDEDYLIQILEEIATN